MIRIAITVLSTALSALIICLALFNLPSKVQASTQAEQTQEFSTALNAGQAIQELGDNLSGKAVTFTFRVRTDAPNTQQFSFTTHNTRIYDKDNNNSFIASCFPADSNPNDPLRGLQFNTSNVPSGYQDVSIDFSCRNYSFISGHRYIIKLDNAGLFTHFHFAAASYGNSGNDFFSAGGLRYGNENINDFLNNSGNCDPAKYNYGSTSALGNGCFVWFLPKNDLYFKLTDAPYAPPSTRTPVIFIPGIGGSELKVATETNWSAPDGHGGEYRNTYAKDELVWMNILKAALPGNDDYFDVLRMKTDGVNSEANIQITDKILDVAYGETINFFKDNGYVENQDFFVFPYDFRKDIAQTEPLLDQKINSILQQTNASKVNLVAHSMGGLVARNYISKPHNAQKVKKLITLGTPYLGAPKFLKALMYGDCLMFGNNKACLGLSPSELQELVRNWISGFQLSPSRLYYSFYNGADSNHRVPFIDNVDFDGNGIVGQLDYIQMNELLLNLGYNSQLLPFAEMFHKLDYQLVEANGVNVNIVAGSGIGTVGQIVENVKSDLVGRQTATCKINPVNGDSTVPLFSASLDDPSTATSFKGAANLYYTNQNHGDLPGKGAAMNLVKNILNDDSALPFNVSAKHFQMTGFFLEVCSPVNMHIYDSQNNHTGPLPNGDFEINIPGSTYDELDHSKFVFLPNDGLYTIKFEATDQGSFDFKVREYRNDTNRKTTLYKNVPLITTTKAEAIFDTSSSQSPTILLDREGDGIVDHHITPSVELGGTTTEDEISPRTALKIKGVKNAADWYHDDITIELTASDGDGSGVNKIEYTLDNGKTINTYSDPFIINEDGVMLLKFRSIDNAGNEEDPQKVELKIDKTSPELKIQFNLQNQEFDFVAIDNLTEVQIKDQDSQISLIDMAGNETVITIAEKDKPRKEKIVFKSITYNSSKFELKDISFTARLDLNKNTTLIKEFDQKVVIRGDEKLKTTFNPKMNKTKIELKIPQNKKQIEEKEGLVLVSVTTNRGEITTNY